jgi:hypothetical protein
VPWIETLEKQVQAKGLRQVAKELGISKTTVSLVVKGKYQASTKKVQNRVAAIYGNKGQVNCPFLDIIGPDRCADNWEKARRIGGFVSNPEKLRLYRECLKCEVRR